MLERNGNAEPLSLGFNLLSVTVMAVCSTLVASVGAVGASAPAVLFLSKKNRPRTPAADLFFEVPTLRQQCRNHEGKDRDDPGDRRRRPRFRPVDLAEYAQSNSHKDHYPDSNEINAPDQRK